MQEHFRKTASSFDDLYGKDDDPERWHQRVLRPGLFLRAEMAVSVVKSHNHPTVLDVGCGSGRLGELVLKAGARKYVGIDFSEPMILLAKQRLAAAGDKVDLLTGDFMDRSLDGRFDVILALGLFDYVEDPSAFIRKMYELSSGSTVATFPRWTWFKGPIRKFRYEFMNRCPIFNYTERELRFLHSAAGFRDVRVEPLTRGGFFARAKR